MSIIRVGFIIEFTDWMGGLNYFKNIFQAINDLPGNDIAPIIFCGKKTDLDSLNGTAKIIRSSLFDRHSFFWFLSKFCRRFISQKDFLLFLLLKKHNIDVISHSRVLWADCSIPSIAWIPDFQYLHLPHLFTAKDIVDRDASVKKIIRESSGVILSSRSALDDLNNFDMPIPSKTFILNFVANIADGISSAAEAEEVSGKYGLDRPWFHIPNQFWAHKNHSIVLEALKLLRERGKNPLVVSTGSTSDFRNPDFFQSITKMVRINDLKSNFLILGMVPVIDLELIMRNSVAIINPSLFEGWSTSVEEAKAMGKTIILSDIPVHREQQPKNGFYFAADDANMLANHMELILDEFDLEDDIKRQSQAKTVHRDKRIKFGAEYKNIVFSIFYPKYK